MNPSLENQPEQQSEAMDWRALVEQSADAIYCTNLEGEITFVNAAAEALYGYRLEEVRGRRPELFHAEREGSVMLAQMEAAMRHAESFVGEALHRRKDGTTFWCYMVFYPVRSAGGEPRFWVGLQRNLSEHRQLLEVQRKAREEAERLSHAKDQFLAVLSHELRTPLGPILGLVDLLLENQALDKEVHECLRIIYNSASTQSKLIEDLLELTRFELGKTRIQAGPFIFEQERSLLLGTYQLPCQSKGIQFSIEIDQGVPSMLETDPLRLRQILYNLLNNALKFTLKGAIRVRMRMEGDAQQELVIEVTDTGEGIPEAELERIFELFMQRDASATRTRGGLGIGLALVSRYCHLLGGSVQCESCLGQGSTFTVRLPVPLPPGLVKPIVSVS